MTREQAIEIARECAKAKPQSYYAEPFQPHEWVIDAILAHDSRIRAESQKRLVEFISRNLFEGIYTSEISGLVERFNTKEGCS